MISLAIEEHIKQNFNFTGFLEGVGFNYGSGEGMTEPYIIMFKVNDPERPITLCNEQGDSGEALFQFNGYSGGVYSASNAAHTEQILEEMKNQVKNLKGAISTSFGDYRIQRNQTEGVRLISEGQEEAQTWGAFFESILVWERF
jgi:hypothetical protein